MIELPLIDLANPLRREHPLAQGLAAWWLPLTGLDGGKYLYDLCGGNHAALTYPDTTTRAWVAGGTGPGLAALRFDRDASEYKCQAPYSPRLAVGTGDFSAVSWEWHAGDMTAQPTFTRNSGSFGVDCRFLRWSGGPARYWVAGTYRDTVYLPVGQWLCRVLVRRGGIAADYLNGRPSGVSWSAAGNIDATQNPVIMGWDWPRYDYRFSGRLGGAAWYRRALSAAEVRDLYAEGRRGYPGMLRRLRLPVGRGVPPAVVRDGPAWYGSPGEWARSWSGSPGEQGRTWQGGESEWGRTWQGDPAEQGV